MSPAQAATQVQTSPLIPEKYLDVPSQRLYYLSIGLFCQGVKAFDFLRSLTSDDGGHQLFHKWLLVDFVYCILLSALRIPRLNYSKAVVVLQIISLWFLNGLMFGGIRVNLYGGDRPASRSGHSEHVEWAATPQSPRLLDYVAPFTFGLLSSEQVGSSDSHLLGQHTVRMSPISTAQLNANRESFCLPSAGSSVLIPILLNNTNPVHVTYSITPLGHEGAKQRDVERVDLTSKDLKAIEQARLELLQASRPSASNDSGDEYDEYDDEETDGPQDNSRSGLQKTQSLVHIKLSKPAIIRLEKVVDSSNVESRLVIPSEALVVPCPKAEFVPEKQAADNIRCLGQDPDVQLMMDISGIPLLSLRWSRSMNGRRDAFLVEGIEGSHSEKHPTPYDDEPSPQVSIQTKAHRSVAAPTQLRVPLTVSLDSPGTHDYALEEMDAVGNVVMISPDSKAASESNAIQSFKVLQRPSMSFKYCSPGNPTALLMGSETSLTVSANEADPFDAPWSVDLKYKPHAGAENKKHKAWKKTLTTQSGKREISVGVNAPGEYTITGVRGKWCNGDVLAPESCTVLERPIPTAEISWKKIHECSGDTGVSASLVLHGTPPFQVYYRTQKDSDPAQERSKTFATSRGEFTIQPEHSGHYTFTFTRISDANYKKVELNGPTIDQIVHPPASAEFAHFDGAGRKKKVISSCEGNLIDVDVDLCGSGPWNLEVQVVGPRSSETIKFPEIDSPRKTLQIPIPSQIDKDGGSFDIDLVSVEDKYGCKRTLSSPGISVNVRRLKPTVKFYGPDGKRHVTVLEHKRASLPLRLTGDGPWRLKYQHTGTEGRRISSAVLNTPNDYLHVTESGDYELLEISDSQCPGNVVTESSTYTAYCLNDHFTPLDKLSTDGVISLEGRPPFQLMLSIKNLAASTIDHTTIQVFDHYWKVELRSYQFQSIGPHLVVIESVSDSSGCPHAALDPLSSSIWVDVSETAAIVPFDKREHYCVGEVAQFQLEGTPP